MTRREMIERAAMAGVALSASAAQGAATTQLARPLVLGHRGSCAQYPEHTLASYAEAIAAGADFIEPDLVSTRDGVLVVRHENLMTDDTDVADHPEFASRKRTQVIDGETMTGWFTEDFTLAELKTLRAREPLPALRPESAKFNDRFQIVTFEEMADFIAAEAARAGRPIGVIPELKHGAHFEAIGLPLEERFLATVRASRYLSTAPMIVQSFEIANLKWLRANLKGLPNVRLMQLTENDVPPADRAVKGDKRTWGELLTPAGLAEIASYAEFIAPYRLDLIPVGKDGRLGQPTGLIQAAHQAGLLVGTWTFRPENKYIPANLRNKDAELARNPAGAIADIRTHLDAGLDAFFTDDVAVGRAAVDGWRRRAR
ncbi:MAG: glycerophosphodiester phosphodiesterase [Proteobacteria bacterium]|nr:glycerophosphodiester phosphodiesterase [Pseudomonadota bacterium]